MGPLGSCATLPIKEDKTMFYIVIKQDGHITTRTKCIGECFLLVVVGCSLMREMFYDKIVYGFVLLTCSMWKLENVNN